MADEMLSGPDLGGGYLHQLTTRSDGKRARFTYHAQSGGADASGPPLGPLDAFGFRHPSEPCPFGGPRCWHRSFETAPGAATTVRQSYNRMRFVLTTLLEQRYAGRPVAVEAALTELIARLGDPGSSGSGWWYVGGSTAAWLQGAALAPNDIDLGTDPAGVPRIAEALKEYLVEPLAVTEGGGGVPVLAARAFVGTMREGALTEWGADQALAPRAGRFYEWSGDPQRVRTRTVPFQGHTVVVTRPEYALVRALEKGRTASVEAIRASLRSIGVDRDLWSELLTQSTLSAERRTVEAEVPWS